MANNWCGPNCPIDCDDVLAVIPASLLGCETPNDDAITEIFFSRAPLVSGNLTEWNSRLSNSSTDSGTAIRSIKNIEASLARVDPTFKTSQRGSAIPQDVDRIIAFSIEDDKDDAYNYYAAMQCGMKGYFWFRSGPHMYGGLSGIESTLVTTYEINKESEQMAHNWAGQVRFRSTCFPSRTLAVI